jgi:hypothetical protein
MEMLFKNLSNPPPEAEKIEILRRNMRPELADRLAVYDIITVEQIFNVMKHLERTTYVKQRRGNPSAEPLEPAFFTPEPTTSARSRTTRRVYEVEESDGDSEVAEVAAVDRTRRKQGQNRRPEPTPDENQVGRSTGQQTKVVCWNCDEAGHNFRQCSKPKEQDFCYYCGEKNTISPHCQRCKAGNGEGTDR